MKTIRRKLETKSFWTNKEDQVHDNYECIDQNDQIDPHDYEQDESFYDLLSENTILDTTVVGECKLILPFKITSFDIIAEKEEYLIYLATSLGNLIYFISIKIHSLI